MNGPVQLQVIRGGRMDQADRREAFALAHPEVEWLGRIGGADGAHSAYVRLPRGGYQAGAETLGGLLDKLAEFFGEGPGR